MQEDSPSLLVRLDDTYLALHEQERKLREAIAAEETVQPVGWYDAVQEITRLQAAVHVLAVTDEFGALAAQLDAFLELPRRRDEAQQHELGRSVVALALDDAYGITNRKELRQFIDGTWKTPETDQTPVALCFLVDRVSLYASDTDNETAAAYALSANAETEALSAVRALGTRRLIERLVADHRPVNDYELTQLTIDIAAQGSALGITREYARKRLLRWWRTNLIYEGEPVVIVTGSRNQTLISLNPKLRGRLHIVPLDTDPTP